MKAVHSEVTTGLAARWDPAWKLDPTLVAHAEPRLSRIQVECLFGSRSHSSLHDGATLALLGRHDGPMLEELAAQIPPHTTMQTTEVTRPFKVRLSGVPPEERDVVIVRDHVVVGDRSIIRAEAGRGFWHIPATRPVSTSIQIAVFEPHETARFSSPSRSTH